MPMRNQTVILLALFLLSGLLWFAATPPEPLHPESAKAQPPVIMTSNAPTISPVNFFSPPLFASGPIPELSVNSKPNESLHEKLINKGLPKLLADKEGSYDNLNELFRGNGTSSIDLQSDWALRHFFPNRNLPSLRMRVIKNQHTGEYLPAGGALALPRTGFEAGYETELNSEEYNATLQWKKSF